MSDILSQEIITHWNQLRGMTYDFLKLLKNDDLCNKLPFKESQSLGDQFYCMIGAQESNLSLITDNKWSGMKCSLDETQELDINTIIKHMRSADALLIEVLKSVELLKRFNDGKSPLLHYMVLAEHEAHHHGQIINYMYAFNLQIPQSWNEKWALTKT